MESTCFKKRDCNQPELLTQGEPVRGGVEDLRHDLHHEVEQVATGHAPVQVPVQIQGVQGEIPASSHCFLIFSSLDLLVYC